MFTNRSQKKVEVKSRTICKGETAAMDGLSLPPPPRLHRYSPLLPLSQRQAAGAVSSVNGLGLTSRDATAVADRQHNIARKMVAGFCRTQRSRRQLEDY